MKIKAIITGTTGMVGKSVLLECLDSDHVEAVLVINRSSIGIKHPKLKEIIHSNFFDLTDLRDQLKGYNACYFCLGVSSFRKSEEWFSKYTYDLTKHFAQTIFEINPNSVFTYVSGAGCDSSEKGNVMWARVKGRTENMILKLGFKDAYMFRPGGILPERGVKSKTKLYQLGYDLMKPFNPLIRKHFTSSITTSILLGRAMIELSLHPRENKFLENPQITEIGSKLM